MNTAKQNTIKALQTLHWAMLLGQIIFAAMAVFLVYTQKFVSSLSHLDQTLQIVALAVSFACFFIGSSLFRKKIQHAREVSVTVGDKAAIYRSASILQWALLEGASLFCIVCFMLVGNYAFLALAGALLLWFTLTAPSKVKIMLLLRLSENEMEDF